MIFRILQTSSLQTHLTAGNQGGRLLDEKLGIDGVIVLKVKHRYLDILAKLVLTV